jgi:hypothetical protein
LIDAYHTLKEKCEDGLEDKKVVAAAFDEIVRGLKEKTSKELSDEKNKAVSEYKSFVDEKFEILEGYSAKLCKDDCKDTDKIIAKIGNLVEPEMEGTSLSDDLSFNDVTNENIPSEKKSEDEISSQAGIYTDDGITENSPSEDDTKVTNDTVINDKIKEEFASYNSVLEVYQYIRNNYQTEFYYGSRKGAIGTFEQKSGNDYDIASLLVGVLRDRNVPTKYVQAEIEITAEQAIEWTGAKDSKTAAKVIGALGNPVKTVNGSEGVESVKFEHVWVLAYVPYTDYRGTGNQSGKKLWIPLDASFKKVKFVKDVDLSKIGEYLQNEENYITDGTTINGYNIGNLTEFVQKDNSALTKYMLENGYGEDNMTEAFGGLKIVEEDFGYLPLSTPFKVNNVIDSFTDIPEKLTAQITISLGRDTKFIDTSGYKNEFSKSLFTTDIYGKRISIAYLPATEEDENIIKKYNGLFNTPAYLIKLKPTLYIDGKVVEQGSSVIAGTTQRYNIKVKSLVKTVDDESETNIITAGGIYTIAIDYGKIAADELQNIANNIKELETAINDENIYTEAKMGEMLNSVSKAYFSQLDMYNAFVAGQREVIQTRDLTFGIVGFSVNAVYAFGRATELNEGGMFLDICHDVHSVVSLNSNIQSEKEYMLQTGIYASAMEHGVLEQFTEIESVSTIKTLQYAINNGIAIHSISKENIKEELVQLNVSETVIEEIKKAVNEGKIVIIPEETITINQWSGSGYMVLDPDTYACGYMISGGLSGGAMTVPQMLASYVVQVLVGIGTMILWELLTTALLAVLPCGWIAATAKFIIKAAEIYLMVSAINHIVELGEQFNETGDIKYLQEMLIEIAALCTLTVISTLAGEKISRLKEKVVDVIDAAGLKGACFVAGTIVNASKGKVPIEQINAGDKVLSFNPGTLEVSDKKVNAIFSKNVYELVHVKIRNEIITSTTNHPFYVIDRGFVGAENLRAGDVLITVNGERAIVEWIQHEILEKPVTVYNFSVEDNHTYFVGNCGIGVHNACEIKITPDTLKNIDEYLKGNLLFEEVLNDFAQVYADCVINNPKWSWKKEMNFGRILSNSEQKLIRKAAIDNSYIPDVKVSKSDGLRIGEADFKNARYKNGDYVKQPNVDEYNPITKKYQPGNAENKDIYMGNVKLEPEEYKLSDSNQFNICNKRFKEKYGIDVPEGYTWHHTLEPGCMELIRTGVHRCFPHNGARTCGQWAEGKR